MATSNQTKMEKQRTAVEAAIERWRAGILVTIEAALKMLDHDLPKLLREASIASAVGPAVDPALWRAKAGDLVHDVAWLTAALPLWRHAREAKDRAVAEVEAPAATDEKKESA